MAFFLITTFFVAGCKNVENHFETHSSVTAYEKKQGVIKVELMGENFATFENEKDIEVFVNAVKNAKKIAGVLDVVKSNYEFHLIYANNKTKSFFLWLDNEEQTGMIMDKEDTHTGYKLQKRDVLELQKLVTK
ncbi:MAG TPA: hypothetical protein VEY68_01525 [Anoxybacillus sp.]|nr:hypothetical protein [Anoxybacillus sp.]